MTPEEIAAQRAEIAAIPIDSAPMYLRGRIRRMAADWAHCLDVIEHLQQVQSALPAAIAEQLKGPA